MVGHSALSSKALGKRPATKNNLRSNGIHSVSPVDALASSFDSSSLSAAGPSAATQTRQKRILPTRTRRGGPTGFGNCDADQLILDGVQRKGESEPLIPATTVFILTTDSSLIPPESEDDLGLNALANERYFERPEVIKALKEQQEIQTPEYTALTDDARVGGRLRVRGEEETPDLSDAAYERRHRKFETHEKRQKFREKEKLQHDHYKLKERIEILRGMDASAFMNLPPSTFVGWHRTPPDMDGEDEGTEPHAHAGSAEGEWRKKIILGVATSLEERYRFLLPNEKKAIEKARSRISMSVDNDQDVEEDEVDEEEVQEEEVPLEEEAEVEVEEEQEELDVDVEEQVEEVGGEEVVVEVEEVKEVEDEEMEEEKVPEPVEEKEPESEGEPELDVEKEPEQEVEPEPEQEVEKEPEPEPGPEPEPEPEPEVAVPEQEMENEPEMAVEAEKEVVEVEAEKEVAVEEEKEQAPMANGAEETASVEISTPPLESASASSVAAAKNRRVTLRLPPPPSPVTPASKRSRRKRVHSESIELDQEQVNGLEVAQPELRHEPQAPGPTPVEAIQIDETPATNAIAAPTPTPTPTPTPARQPRNRRRETEPKMIGDIMESVNAPPDNTSLPPSVPSHFMSTWRIEPAHVPTVEVPTLQDSMPSVSTARKRQRVASSHAPKQQPAVAGERGREVASRKRARDESEYRRAESPAQSMHNPPPPRRKPEINGSPSISHISQSIPISQGIPGYNEEVSTGGRRQPLPAILVAASHNEGPESRKTSRTLMAFGVKLPPIENMEFEPPDWLELPFDEAFANAGPPMQNGVLMMENHGVQ